MFHFFPFLKHRNMKSLNSNSQLQTSKKNKNKNKNKNNLYNNATIRRTSDPLQYRGKHPLKYRGTWVKGVDLV